MTLRNTFVAASAAIMISGCGAIFPDQIRVSNIGENKVYNVVVTYTNLDINFYEMDPGESHSIRIYPMTVGSLKVSYVLNGEALEFDAGIYSMPSDSINCEIEIDDDNVQYIC